jgi:TonB family protein
VKIVANLNVKTNEISTREIRSVFMQEIHALSDGTRVEPVVRRRRSTPDVFLKEFLGQSDDAFEKYYQILVFTGRGSMPKAFGSDPEVVAYVARTSGAIGYVDSEAETRGVKILVIVDEPTPVERKLRVRVEPVYPEELQKRGIGGVVRLRITITPKGEVKNAQLLGGSAILGEAAIEAVHKWKYSAAFSQTITNVSITFNPRH